MVVILKLPNYRIKELYKALRKIRDAPDTIERSQGICNQPGVPYMIPSDRHKLFSDWPLYNGRYAYPIPSPDSALSDPGDYYMFCDDHWDTETEYGRNRWSLLEHVIQVAATAVSGR